MPEFPKRITVRRRGLNGAKILIDGQEFPWYISSDGVTIPNVSRDGIPSIVIEILADCVDVINDLTGDGDG